jgi:hypothetical protein
MERFMQTFPWKRVLVGGVGLVLVAGAIRLLFRSPDPDLSVVAPGARSDGPPASPTQPVVLEGKADLAVPPLSSTTVNLTPPAPSAEPAESDARISAMVGAVEAGRAASSEAGRLISMLIGSSEPTDQVSGLALMAGMGMLDAQQDYSKYLPEVVLAAVDLCGSLFGDSAAQALLDEWMKDMGGSRLAGEMAHTLLLEARLPYGGGSAALELMMSVNDPQAIFAGLYEFAVNVELPPAIRAEALFLLRARMGSAPARNYVRDCVEQVREDGDAWATRAEHLLEWMGDSSAAPSDSGVVNRHAIEDALARSYSGRIQDLELFLRHGIKDGWVKMDAETMAFLRESMADLDEASLEGPDLAALRRLRLEIDSWSLAP